MSTFNEKIDFLLTSSVLRATVATALLTTALCSNLAKTQTGQSKWQWLKTSALNHVLPFVVPTVLGLIWLTLVNVFVPAPYMDEFFHIPQAQVFCESKYTQWDDKITTPPGLYYLSIIWARISGHQDCSVETLRRFNVFVTGCTAIVAGVCRAKTEDRLPKGQTYSSYAIHTGINIALFPVLFFFSGLYYTDVASTCVVLVAYLNHLDRLRQGTVGGSIINDLYTVFLGVLALLMRQTNVFWVVVYMGGVEAIQALKDLPVGYEVPRIDTWTQQAKFFVWKSSIGSIHDPPLQAAWPDDLVLCLLSIGVAALFNVGTILRRIYPHVIIVGLFAGFVVWNGGVVLGDKTNHVATLHLTQMLYIWPLFAFFSAPLFLPPILHLLTVIQKHATALISPKPAASATVPAKQQQIKPPQGQVYYFGILLSIILLGASTLAAGLIVHYNTIIHPFTLADNRHYMFYVFRYTVMRGPTVRLLLVPVYIFCAILAWTSLYQLQPNVKSGSAGVRAGTPVTEVPTAQVIMLLVTTTLSLMTAPLVEPRYFILPWVFWRLLVPRRTTTRRHGLDWTLALESAWFLVVNVVLMYIFLARPYVWKLEDGTVLDGGNIQRFMW